MSLSRPNFDFCACLGKNVVKRGASEKKGIDPMQKWLPLNYSFVGIQNSLTNLVRDNKFFTIFVSKTKLVRLL